MKTTSHLLLALLFTLPGLTQPGRVKNWMHKEDKGDYYEGSYSLQVKSPPLEMIGLSDSFEPFVYNQGRQLSVAFKYPKEDVYFFLKAEEKRILRFYMMESKPDTLREDHRVFGPWPVDEVLRDLNVMPSNLTVLLRLKSDVSNFYVPVTVYHSTRPDSLETYQAIFRLGRNILGGEFRVYKGLFEGTPGSDFLAQRSRIGGHKAGAGFQIKIDKDRLSGYSGWATVQLNLREKNRPVTIKHEFYFYHIDD